MARTRRTIRALEEGTPSGTTQVISSTVEIPPHSTYASTQGEAQVGATQPQPQGTTLPTIQGTNPQVQQVGGSGHAGRSEARGQSPPYIRGLAPIPEDREFSSPYTERDSESSDDEVALRRRRPGKEPMADGRQRPQSAQGANPQEVQERIRAHEAEIQRLRRDLEAHQATRPQIPPRGRNPPPVIDLDGPGAKESLRDYLNRFTKEALKVPDLDDKVAMIALQQGTRDEFFKMSLAKRPPESMLQLQERAGKYIKVEESMRKTVVSNEPTGGKKRKTDLEYIAKDKYPRTEQNPDSTPKKGGPGQKFTEYAKLNAPRSQILMEIEKDRDIRWPKPLKADPTKLEKSKYCRFHKDVGHDTDECRQLKDEIEFLIRKGRLNKYTGEGGDRNNNGRKNFEDRRRDQDDQGKAYTREVMHIVGEAPKRARTEVTLAFDDSDLEGVKFPHDDPLVITPVIGNSPVKRVLVDNGASVDILLHDTFLRMGYNDSQLTPTDMPI
ncbi:hypothetical protein AgCh_029036 [Apium graveolens]